MQCPQCQDENAPDAKFRNQCGTPLTIRCGWRISHRRAAVYVLGSSLRLCYGQVMPFTLTEASQEIVSKSTTTGPGK